MNWSTDVGAVGYAGDSSFDAATGAYHIKGAGVGLSGSADAFHFAYYEVVRGDGQMVVRVSSADALAQVALVIRESLDANAASAAGAVHNGAAQFIRRALTGSNATTEGTVGVSVPCWLKLVRSGSTVATFTSLDAQNWTSLGAGPVTLANPTVYVGFAVSNGAPGASGTMMASFDGIQSTFLPDENLALWLKADAGVVQDASGRVSTWADQSGNGMDASQATTASQPQAVTAVMNGQPVIRFGGNSGYLQLPSGFNDFSQGFTALVVARPTNVNNWQRYFDLGNGQDNSNILLARQGTSDTLAFFCNNPGIQVYAPGAIALNACQLFECEQGANTVTLYKNGLPVASGSGGVLGSVLRTSNFIGKSNWNGDPLFQGDIAEIVLFNRALSDSQRQSWERYLNVKYGFAAPPPTPTQLAGTMLSATQIVLTWGEDPAASVTSYQLERQNADGTWSIIALLGPGTFSYIDNAVVAGVNYRYRISALNGYGASAPSPVTDFMTDPGTGQATFPTVGMQFWLRADLGIQADANGSVSQWTDQAGGGRAAVQANTGNRPALISNGSNGRAAVRFNGSNSYLDTNLVGAGGQELTFFVVTKGTNYQSLLRFQDYSSFLIYPWMSNAFVDSADGSTPGGVDSGLVANAWNIGAVTYRSSGQIVTYRNGAQVASRAANDANLPTGAPLTMGRYFGGSEYTAADVAEVFIYNRALGESERQAVEAYLNTKYAVVVPPGAPSALAGNAISSSQASLLWQLAGSGGAATGFAVERKPADGSGGYMEVANLAGDQISSYIDEGLVTGSAYTYHLRAYNAAGYSGYSAEITVTMPAAGALPASLPAIDALNLWLRPDTGVILDSNNLVTAWTDLSGHGDNALAAAGSQPQWVDNAINGQSTLRFDGNNTFLLVNRPVVPSSNNATILAVVRLPDTNTKGMFIKNGSPYDGYALGVGSGTMDSGGNDALALYEYVRWVNGGSQWGTGTVLAEMSIDATGTPALYRNGTLLGNFGGGAARTPTASTGIGGSGGRCFRGDIAEVLMFNRPLTDFERRGWESYLNAKYQFNPPPAALQQVSAAALSSSQLLLTWYEPSAAVDGFTVQRQNADGTWSLRAVLGPRTTSYVDGGLAAGGQYHYRILAYNSAGSSQVASVDGTTTSAGGAGGVFPTAGMRLWLEADAGMTVADGGRIAAWADQSGSNFAVEQSNAGNRPVRVTDGLNGLPAVHFNGSSTYLNLARGIFNGLTASEVFVVLRSAYATGNGNGLWRLTDRENAFYPEGDRVKELFGSTNRYEFGPPVPLDQFNLYNISAGPGAWTARMDGVVVCNAAINTVDFNAGAYLLGMTRDGQVFNGDIAEVLIFDHTLSEGERQLVSQHLASKYALATPPQTPAGLVAQALSPVNVSLTWRYPSRNEATYFDVEREVTGSNSYQLLNRVSNTTSIIDSTAVAGISYTYRVRAVNWAGAASDASDETQATTPTSGLALPTGGLRLWLAADAGAAGSVSDWLDQSGSGNNAQQGSTGNQPQLLSNALNGQPAVHFNGSQYLRFPNGIFSGMTAGEVFVVLRSAYATGNGNGLWRLTDRENAFYPEGDRVKELFGSTNRYEFAPSAPLDQFNLYNVSAGAGTWTARLNEQVVCTTTGNTVDFNAGAYLLGMTRDGQCLRGDIAEVMIFDHALGADERLVIEQYLAGKYALASNPAAPTGLSVRALSPTQISLTWQYPAQNSATQFLVERAPAGTEDYQTIATLGGITSYLDTTAVAGTAYSYRLVARDLAGNTSAASSVVQIVAPATGTTLSLGGLRVWLEAGAGTSGGALGAWLDQSGRGNHAQQNNAGNQPAVVADALNGQPAVHFDGNSYLQFSGNPLGGVASAEVLVVLRAATPVGGAQGLWRFTDRENDFYPEGNHLCATFGTQNRYAPLGYSAPLDQFNLYDVSAASGAWTARLNEQVLYTTTGNVVDFNAGAYLLGMTRDGQRFNGDIAEVMIFDHALTDADRLAVEGYLAGKYALAATPPAPTALSARALSPTQVSLTWQYPASNNATQFTVERAIAGTGNYQKVAVVNNGTSFIDNTAVAGASYTYRVTATDLAGNVSVASATATADIPQTGLTLATTGLRVWLKADAGATSGALASWLDQSGHGNNAQQNNAGNQPVVVADALNGRPAARFNGGQYLQFPGSVLDNVGEAEVLVVLKAADPLTNNCGLWRFSDSENEFYPLSNGAIYENFGSNNRYGPVTPPVPLDQFNLYNVSAAANGSYTLRMNGQALFATTNNPLRFSAGAYLLGMTRDGYAFRGDIAEMLMFDRPLTILERQGWENYLNSKYVLVATPAVPTALSVIPLSATQLILSWNESSTGVTSYTVERQNTDGTWSVIAVLPGTASQFIDGSLTAGHSYNYRVRATSLGSSSPTVTVSGSTPVASDGVFPTNALQLWLRAGAGTATDANGRISAWTDQSGNNHHATQADGGLQPTLVDAAAADNDGLPIVRFDGAGRHLDFPDTGAVDDFTVFAVARTAQTHEIDTQSNAGLAGTSGQHYLLGGLPSGDRAGSVVSLGTNGVSVYEHANGYLPPLAVYAGDVGAARNLVRVRYSAKQAQIFLNGALAQTGLISPQPHVRAPINVGGLNYGYFTGDVAEVLIYNAALTDGQCAAVEAYLNARYAVVTGPDAPTALTGRAISASQANLFWQVAASGGEATGFSIERRPANGGGYAEVAAVAGDRVSSYIDEGLAPGTAYVYRMRSYNITGYSTYSPEAAVTMPAAGTAPEGLPAVDALALWLRAETGVVKDANNSVSAWIDASGHGNDARPPSAAGQPQWIDGAVNGKPTLRFGGSGQLLATAASAVPNNQNVTVLAVVTLPDANVGGTFVRNDGFSLGVGNTALDNAGNAAIGLYEYVRWVPTGQKWGTGTVLAGMSIDEYGQPTFYRNGINLGTVAGSTPNYTTAQTTIGGDPLWPGRSLRGDVAEVLMFDRPLTDAERRTWEDYLNAKYQFNPPAATPAPFAVAAFSSTQLSMTWSESSSTCDSFLVERQKPDGTWAVIATTASAVRGYVDGGLTPGTAYTYRVTATSPYGNSAASASASATTANAGDILLPTDGMQLWLRADAGLTLDADGSVNSWADLLTGHLASQPDAGSRPVLVANSVNGMPVVRFNGTSNFLSTDVSVAGGRELTIFVVTKGTNYQSLLRAQYAGSSDYLVYPWSASQLFINSNDQGSYGGLRSGLVAGRWNLGSVIHKAGDQVTTYCDGGVVASRSASGENLPNGPALTLGRYDGGSEYLAADVAEVLIYNRVLSDSERRAVEHYCVVRYALAAFLGGDANADPDGDGLTNYQEYLAGTDPLDYYNGQTPRISIVSGNNQRGVAGVCVSQPLRVKVNNAAGVPSPNAPVVFTVTRATGRLADPASPAAFASTVTVRADADGIASALFQAPAGTLLATSLVTATAGNAGASSRATFVEAIVDDDDTSGDGLPDGWKARYGLDLTANNASGDPDGDGLTNLQEYRLGTDPTVADATADGIPYTWIIAKGLDPRFDSLDALDPGGSGLTYRQEYALEQATVDLWKFDEGTPSTVAASSAGRRDAGSLVNGPLWASDPDGSGALLFGQPGARVSVGNAADGHLDFGPAQSFSVSARFLTGDAGASRLVGKGMEAVTAAGYQLGIEQGRLTVGVGTGSTQSPALCLRTVAAFNDGQWHHVAMTFDRAASQACVYVDGILQLLTVDSGSAGTSQGTAVAFDPAAVTLSAARPEAAFSVGARDADGAESFVGNVDNVGLFSKALTPKEVKALAGSQNNSPPVVAIDAPLHGTEFPETGSITINAQAAAAGGTIAKVEFFSGTAKLGEALAFPYTMIWTQVPIGTFALVAKATDSRGAAATSSPVGIVVSTDSDHDGLPDDWELRYFGNLDQTADGSFLNDGISNLSKFRRGIDPTKPISADANAAAAVMLKVYTPLQP